MPLPTHAAAARALATVLLAAALAACGERLPTESAAPSEPGPSAATAAAIGPVNARQLGVLPGETQSEATYVTDDMVVYGTSGARFFRWTEATGMQEVSSIPAAPVYPVPAGAPAVEFREANVHGEVTGGPPLFAAGPGLPFRWSASEGLRPIRSPRSAAPYYNLVPYRGIAINRWGHVALAFSPCNCRDDERFMFWSPVDTMPVAASANWPFFVFGDDDVLYTHRSIELTTFFLSLQGRASSPHLVGGDVGIALVPSALTPGAPPTPPGCYQSPSTQGPIGVRVLAANAHFLAVGYQEKQCTSYHQAVLWDLRALERPRPLVSARDTLRGRFGAPTILPYRFDARQSAGPWTVTVDWGDQATTTDTAGAPGVRHVRTHTYATAGTYLARTYVRDALGAWNVDETVLRATVPNAAPRVRLAPLVAGDAVAGREFVVRATFSDDSPDDGPWTFTADWGTSTHATGTDAIGTTRGRRFRADPIDLHFTYDTPGTYTFRFSVADRYGATSATVQATVRVVAAPQ